MAMVHQLAACPCACEEHNFWLQTARRALAASPSDHPHHHEDAGPSVDHDHQGCTDLLAVRSVQANDNRYDAAGAQAPEPHAPAPCVPLAVAASTGGRSPDASLAYVASAPKVRALLQVYQI